MASFLADLIVVSHLAYVAFVVLGLALILLGGLLRWGFVRRPGFRWTHLLCTVIPPLEGLAGVTCPLTDWEYDLRQQAGETAAEGSFVGRLAHDILFVEASEETLVACYVAFALTVIAAMVFIRPRRKRPADPSLQSPE